MKRIFPFILLFSILASPLWMKAQNSNLSMFSIDLGINTSLILNQNMYGNPEMAYTPDFGLTGLVSYKHLVNKYGYSLGLGYANLGQKYSGDMGGADAQRRISLNYLQIPLMGIYGLGGKKQPTTWLSFGPQFMLLLTAKQDFNRTEGRVIPNPDLMYQGRTDVVDRFNPIDVMLAFELTHLFSTGLANTSSYESFKNTMWTLSLKGALGLSDINQKKYQISNIHNIYGGSHNFYMGVNIGFMFNAKARNIRNKTQHPGNGVLKIPGYRR